MVFLISKDNCHWLIRNNENISLFSSKKQSETYELESSINIEIGDHDNYFDINILMKTYFSNN
mgnify:CR=1 FL=1